MRLLNQNIKIIPNADDTCFSIINTSNNMELCRIESNEPMNIWINKGWFMNKEEYYNNLKEKE